MPGTSEGIELAGGPHAALVLHGLCGSPLEVRFVARLLHRAGFTVSMPMIDGYSMGSQPKKWTDWLAGADEVYQRLSARYKSVSVGGLSVGATLALALAQHRRDIPCVAAWSATLDYDGWLMPWYRWLFELCYHLGLAGHYVYRETDPYGLKNEKWRARVADAMRRSGGSSAGPAAIPAEFLYQSIVLGRHVERHLSKVSADTLVVHSADDETASPRNADVIYAGIASAHKRKIMLGDSYHIITMDNERDLVARETIRFFQQSILRRHPDEQVKLVSSARALIRLQRRHVVRSN
jgi:carboxylesterase